jgi:hypothetical protein
MPVGTHRVMKRNWYKSGDYVLSRVSQTKYQAILNVYFSPLHSGVLDHLTQKMLERTRSCLREMAPYLKGPGGKEFRGNAKHFGSNFDCTTIGHEILHHLGLCDEYHETEQLSYAGKTIDWSCRPVTAQTSYMRNMNAAFDQIVPQKTICSCDKKCQEIMNNPSARKIYLSMNGYDLINSENSLRRGMDPLCKSTAPKIATQIPQKSFEYRGESGNTFNFKTYRAFASDQSQVFYDESDFICHCPPNHPFCRKMMIELKKYSSNPPPRADCPDSTTPRHEFSQIGHDSKGSRMECENSGRCHLIVSTRGNDQSLLTLTQFNRIIGGDCRGSSPSYERCEEYAYMSKTDPLCESMPKECWDDNYYLQGINQ